jgi:cation transport ATPase
VNHKDYYQILGVGHDATEDEIQDAFHELAREYHPDVNPDPRVIERFKEISAAYDVLSDPEDRAKYDMQIGANRRQQQQTSSRSSSTAWHQQTTYAQQARTTWNHKWSKTPSEQSEEERKDTSIVTTMALIGLVLTLTTLILNVLIEAIDPSIKTVPIGWESYIIIAFFAVGMGALGWGLYLRRRSKCPRCGKTWAREILSKEKDALYYREVLLDGPPSVAYVQYMVRQRCKYCEHKWTSPQSTIEVSFSKR